MNSNKTLLLVVKTGLGLALGLLAAASCGRTGNSGGNGSGNGNNGVTACVPQTFGSCNTCTTPFGAGDGSIGSPFQLCSALHLGNMANVNYVDKSFQMVADIDASSLANIPQMPPTSSAFVFDGQNHTLNNWKGASPIFAVNAGTIKNLNITNANVTAGTNGGLVGRNDVSGTIDKITITTMKLIAACSTGALVGINRGTLSNSSVTGLTFTTAATQCEDTLGGAFGWNAGGTVDTVTVSNSSITTNGFNIGGLGGSNSGTVIRSNVINTTVQGTLIVGGFIGCGGDTDQLQPLGIYCKPATSGSPSVQHSSATGGLVESNLNAGLISPPQVLGGFFGMNISDATNDCYATNKVNAGNADAVGGFVGQSGCNWPGTICPTPTGVATITSFAGFNGSNGVIGFSNFGGFVGLATAGTYNNDYFDTTNTGQVGAQPAGVTSETNATMLTVGGCPGAAAPGYTGFSFTTTWNCPNGDYATLK